MASNGGNSAANDAVELEFMRREDSSWHPCHVSLSSSGLIVDYGGNDSEDMIVDKEEAFARLRVRSVPLQGDDCSFIQEGEHVLANQKSQSKNLFFDAEVEKVLRVRHSKKVYCRCTFLIKWLHQDLKGGTSTVSSSSIMKLAAKSVNIHPTVSAFLNSVKTSSCSGTFSATTILEDSDCEMDLHEFLEKQIKEISSSAYASNTEISKDILLGVEVGTKGQIQCTPVATSKVNKPDVKIPPDPNHLKRSTRSRSKAQTEKEVKDPPPIQGELSGSRSSLNPLAARAALASLMSKSPQNLEFSIYYEGEKGRNYSSDDNAHKHVAMHSLNGIKSYNSPIGNSLSMTDKHFLETSAASVPFVPDSNKVVKSLFSTWTASGKPQLVDASAGTLTKACENENKTSEITDAIASFTCSIAERKLDQPNKATRLTRSAIKRGTGIQNDNTERKTCVEEMELQSSTNTRRFTRSTVYREKESQTMESKKGIKEMISAKYTESDFADKNVAVLEGSVLKEEKSIASFDAEIELLPTEECSSIVKKEKGNKKHVDERSSTDALKLRNSTSTRRLTRSAVHEGKWEKVMEAEEGLKKDELAQNTKSNSSEPSSAQNTKSNSSEGNASGHYHNVLETKEPDSSPLLAEERNKKGKISGAVKTTPKTEGKVAGSDERNQGVKRKSCTSKKQELRSSSRLKFLPRTRSQNKS
ncbi:uncharacterized protein LOC132313150 [Cornus florida]|uniref:uncharacterized protein LOC132313150 n=1 Tax=Cornus florida TaxID=4283 RepID=UPI0028A1C784|nr:uncharacterized protein LOC132313150 [Cornus florida]XP_059667811.1 uncharacterized protein LOC132313150 [Cornus florida]